MRSAKSEKLPEAYFTSRLLSMKEISKFLGFSSKDTIKKLIRNKANPLPSLKIAGVWRFPLDKVMWWLEKQQ